MRRRFRRITSELSELESHLVTTAENVREQAGRMRQHLESVSFAIETFRIGAESQMGILSEFEATLAERNDGISNLLKGLLNDLREGAEVAGPLQQLILDLSNEVPELQEKLGKLPLQQIQQQIAQLRAEAGSLSGELTGILSDLSESAQDAARGLLEALQLFQRGQGKLSDLKRQLDRLKESLDEADEDVLGDFMDEIEDALRKGNI